MNPTENSHWIYDQSAPYSSLNDILSKEPSNYHSLPTIPEHDWDLGWDEHLFAQPESSYARPEQVSGPPTKEPPADESILSQVLKKLSDLSEQGEQLRRDILELQNLCSQRLDSLEKMVMVAQRYVNDLVPWSMNVHEKYSRLMEVAERQGSKAESSSIANVDAHSTE